MSGCLSQKDKENNNKNKQSKHTKEQRTKTQKYAGGFYSRFLSFWTLYFWEHNFSSEKFHSFLAHPLRRPPGPVNAVASARLRGTELLLTPDVFPRPPFPPGRLSLLPTCRQRRLLFPEDVACSICAAASPTLVVLRWQSSWLKSLRSVAASLFCFVGFCNVRFEPPVRFGCSGLHLCDWPEVYSLHESHLALMEYGAVLVNMLVFGGTVHTAL